MQHRTLGRTGLLVSPVCLGTMMFGGQTGARDANRIIAHAFDNGINFIDTADVYAGGASEKIVGKAIRKNRDKWVLATKVGLDRNSMPDEGGLSRHRVMSEVDNSLKRLGTDVIDIYYVHRHDPRTAFDEVVRTFGDLIAAGKIRYWALSNVRAWHIAHYAGLCREMNVPRPAALQPYYNLLNRSPEVELIPAAYHFGIGVVPYSPIARGLLTGKYAAGAKPPAGSRAARKDPRFMSTEWRPESLAIVEKLTAHVEKRGQSLVHFAVAWLLNSKAISSVIAGPRTFGQWQAYLGADAYPWGPEDEALVDSLVNPGQPSTPGYFDPKEPPEGRFPVHPAMKA
ncbi:MAG: aldo/keto reductase [Hyphomicrobiales bacterium]